MALHDERMQILKMIESGQITAEEGSKLLSALMSNATDERPETAPPRWFRVRVTDLQTGKLKVNVNLPLTLLDVGVRMGARFVPPGEIDLNEVVRAIRGGAQGKIVDIEDLEDQERVEILVE